SEDCLSLLFHREAHNSVVKKEANHREDIKKSKIKNKRIPLETVGISRFTFSPYNILGYHIDDPMIRC
ncbi:hypothetical protein, partial [Bacillus thuringiensis]|uniref:hypothetical protein n=1 Tax=Bacillus thuringiensis TaxID=1428 RepID=UPI0005C666A6